MSIQLKCCEGFLLPFKLERKNSGDIPSKLQRLTEIVPFCPRLIIVFLHCDFPGSQGALCERKTKLSGDNIRVKWLHVLSWYTLCWRRVNSLFLTMRHINSNLRKSKSYYIRAKMFCLACKFKGKEMTAEDMARNVQFAKTFWRRKRRRKNTEMSLPSREKNSYPK